MKEIAFDGNKAREIKAKVTFGRIRTRDGFPVNILAWNLKSKYPIAGVVELGKEEYVRQWTYDGKADLRPNVRSGFDLVLEVEGGEA